MRLTPLFAAGLASLALAAPSYAQTTTTPGTVGPGQVITDPASQVAGGPTSGPDSIHVGPGYVDTHSGPPSDGSSPPVASGGSAGAKHQSKAPFHHQPPIKDPAAPAPSPAPAPVPRHQVAPVTHTASAPAAARPTAHASARELPFTGIAAWQIAVMGLALIAAGAGLWRLGEARPQ